MLTKDTLSLFIFLFYNMKTLSIYIDEAGRGPLAWPLHVGVLAPLYYFKKDKFNDSKKLSVQERETLYEKIQWLQNQWKLKYAIGTSSNKEIDEWGMTKATNLAIARAIVLLLQQIVDLPKDFVPLAESLFWEDEQRKQHKELYQKIKILRKKIKEEKKMDIKLIIDGNQKFWLNKDLMIPIKTVINWDAILKEIGMASIVAKVSRDQWMCEVADKAYPQYEFYKHKWYATPLHQKKIAEMGPCDLHRKLFLKELFPNHTIKKV